jgi:hypothetical protein
MLEREQARWQSVESELQQKVAGLLKNTADMSDNNKSMSTNFFVLLGFHDVNSLQWCQLFRFWHNSPDLRLPSLPSPGILSGDLSFGLINSSLSIVWVTVKEADNLDFCLSLSQSQLCQAESKVQQVLDRVVLCPLTG